MLQGFLDLIFPPRCFFCGQITKEAGNYCGCELNTTPHFQCQLCQSNNFHCACTQPLVTPFYYSGNLRKGVLSLKRKENKKAMDFFAGEITRRLLDGYKNSPFVALVPVPTNEKKLIQRGFNQAELLAYSLKEIIGLPVESQLLARNNDSRVQHTLSFKERQANALTSYLPHPDFKGKLEGEYLLVDDIYTSGATLIACGNILKDLGASKIISATCCMTERR